MPASQGIVRSIAGARALRLEVPAHLLRVARLLPEGLADADISIDLGLRPQVARNYVHELLVETGCDNRTALAVALATGRIVLDPRPRAKRRRAHDGP